MNIFFMRNKVIILVFIFVLAFSVVIFFVKRERVLVVRVEEPIVVAEERGTNDSLPWGYYQFPKLYYTEEGIICKIAAKPDSIEAYDGKYLYKVSTDSGITWSTIEESVEDYGLRMSNGCYFQGAVLKNAYESDLLDKYEPDFSSEDGTLYLLDGEQVSVEDYDFSFQCVEYNPVTMEETVFTSDFVWPHMPIRIINGKTCPAGMPLYHFNMHSSGTIIQEKNGSLFLATYSEGFDKDGGVAYGRHYNLYFFRSDDSGRTWKYVSQINTTQEYSEDVYEGFCEPNMVELSNGAYFVLMRTGSGTSLCCAYSYDKGSTWSSITQFSEVGVDPQILKLGW